VRPSERFLNNSVAINVHNRLNVYQVIIRDERFVRLAKLLKARYEVLGLNQAMLSGVLFGLVPCVCTQNNFAVLYGRETSEKYYHPLQTHSLYRKILNTGFIVIREFANKLKSRVPDSSKFNVKRGEAMDFEDATHVLPPALRVHSGVPIPIQQPVDFNEPMSNDHPDMARSMEVVKSVIDVYRAIDAPSPQAKYPWREYVLRALSYNPWPSDVRHVVQQLLDLMEKSWVKVMTAGQWHALMADIVTFLMPRYFKNIPQFGLKEYKSPSCYWVLSFRVNGRDGHFVVRCDDQAFGAFARLMEERSKARAGAPISRHHKEDFLSLLAIGGCTNQSYYIGALENPAVVFEGGRLEQGQLERFRVFLEGAADVQRGGVRRKRRHSSDF